MRNIIFALLICFLSACGSKTTESTANSEKRQYTEQKNPVTVIVLQKGPFRKELVNNGKLVALRKTDLQFRLGEQLEKLSFKNGDYVKAGQVIAGLAPFTFSQQLSNAEIRLNDEVQLIPFSSKKNCRGRISEINPVIDADE